MATSNPSVVLRRGEGWTNQDWQANWPALQDASQLAYEGIEHMNLHYRRRKVGYVDRTDVCEDGYDILGRSFGPVQFELYVGASYPDSEQWFWNTNEWPAIEFHELVHCIRSEYEDDRDDLVERAATEGLAHVGESRFMQSFAGRLAVATVFKGKFARLDSRLLDEFISLADESKHKLDYHEHKVWFEKDTRGASIPNGALLGAQLVNRQLKKYSLADLIKQPAEDVLGL